MQKNILLICVDQMRGDCLGYAGHPDVKTPYLDSLAMAGTYFPNAYTACPSCIAARAALLTGRSPSSNGRVGYCDGIEWNYRQTLAEEMTAAGYYTQCIGKMHVHPQRRLLGFNNIELHDGYLHYSRKSSVRYSENQLVADDYVWWLKDHLGGTADITDTGIECNSWLARPWLYDEKYHPTNWVTDRCLDFFRRRDKDKPFFLMASYVRPHPPYDAPSCWFDIYRNKNLREPFIGDHAAPLDESSRYYSSDNGCIDPDLKNNAMVGYYACISHLDNQIGRLLDGMTFWGLNDNTVVMFVSDHGELLFDHNCYRKTRAFQGSVHVPMFIWGPGIKKQTDRRLCELRDVMPTLLGIAGRTAPDVCEGMDLLAQEQREWIHGEHCGGSIGNQFIVTSSDKYIWYDESGTEFYFNLEKDPNELHNAISDPAYSDRISYLRDILVRDLEGRPEGYSDGSRLICGRPQRAYLDNATGI